MNSSTKPKTYGTAYLMTLVLLIALTPGVTNLATVSLATYATMWPDVDYNSIVLLGTLPMLMMLPTNLLFPAIVKKLGYRITAMIGLAVILVSGLVPVFTMNFQLVLVMRGLTGLAMGLIGPMYTSLLMEYFENKPSIKAKGVGWAQTTTSISGILFSLIAGGLASFGGQITWLAVLIMVPVFVAAMLLPAPSKVLEAERSSSEGAAAVAAEDETKGEDASLVAKENIPVKAWVILVVYLVLFMINISFTVNISFIVQSIGFSASDAGIMMSFASAGNALGAFVYGFGFRFFKDRTAGIGLVINALFAACLVLFSGGNLPLLFLFTFLLSFGWNLFLCWVFYSVNMITPQSRIPTINAITVFVAGAGYFLSGYWNTAISTVFGQVGNYFFPLVVMVVVFGIVGIIAAVKPLVNTSKL